LALCLISADAGAGDRKSSSCDRVVSYFLFPYQGSDSPLHEWWIYDPNRGAKERYLSSTAEFDGVRWDTTFHQVFFSSGDSLYRADWRLGAKPQWITSLPANHGRWWFNPDSECWQTLRITGEGEPGERFYIPYAGELWQSRRDGTHWRRVRADSLNLVELDDDRYQWVDGTPVGREARTVMLDDLAGEAWEDAWSGKTSFVDTSTCIATPDEGKGHEDEQFFFLPLQSTPRRGIAFHHGGSGAPEHDWSGVNGPFYFVDLDHRPKKRIGGDEGLIRSLAAEHCGLLLIPEIRGSPLLDSSGNTVFAQPWNSRNAVWVRTPRK
jgi:hypothetical protein